MRMWRLLLAVSSCFASITTPYGLSLQWSVRAPAVTFTLKLPAGMAREYDYWGVGWKAQGSSEDMKQAEIWIITKTGKFLAYLSHENEEPQRERRSSAVMVSFRSDGDDYEAVIVRKLQTDSLNDIQMAEGGSYTLVYAYGYTSDDDVYLQHSTADSGAVSLVLTNEPPQSPTSPDYPNSSSGSSMPEVGFETTETLQPATSASVTIALLTTLLIALALF